jgi:hypothetical protein
LFRCCSAPLTSAICVKGKARGRKVVVLDQA